MRRAILALALLVPSLSAQNALIVDLSGEWRQSTDDKPEYAGAEFDDRSWATVRLPWTVSSEPGVFWLRRSATLPAGADTSRVVLSLGPVREVYEVFVNGRQVGSTGSFWDTGSAQMARSRTFPLPMELLQGGGRVQVAIRTRRPDRMSTGQAYFLFQDGTYRLQSPEAVVRAEGELLLDRQRAKYAPQFVLAALLLALAALLLGVWLGERAQTDLFWLGLMVGARGMRDGLAYFTLSLDAEPWQAMGGQYVFYALGGVALAELIRVSVKVQSRWWRVGLWSLWLMVLLRGDNFRFVDRFVELVGLTLLFGGWWRLGGLRQPMERQFSVVAVCLLVITRINSSGFGIFPAHIVVSERLWSVQSLTTTVLATILTVLLIRSLTRDRRERQRLTADLEAARVVQQLLLPPAGSATGVFVVEAIYNPAQEVGGDFYWSRVEADGALLIAVGDVSGKGLKAALLVSLAVGILRNEKSGAPGRILEALNEGLADRAGGGFVTCCCLRFEESGAVTVANAGHPAPYADGAELEVAAGLPLGVVTGVEYEETTVTGDRFTIVSDGVVEAENAQRELFGFERTRLASGKAANEIAAAAIAWGQNDDITVVTVRRAG